MVQIFLTIFAFIQLAWGIGPDECPSYDFTDRFGPARDQGSHGLCWAFTASALLEEQECLRNPAFCGNHLSPIDTSRCQWTIGEKEEGSSVKGALKCALETAGVCREIDAPYLERFSLGCIGRIFTRADFAGLEQCLTTDIMAFYRQWKNQVSEKEVCDFHAAPLEKDEDFSKIITLLNQFKNLTTELNNETFQSSLDPLKALLASQDEREFLQKVLIPPACRENRLSFKGKLRSPPDLDIQWINDNPQETSMFQYGKVLEAFRKNRSIGLSFCTTMTREKNFIEKKFITDKNLKCEAHALVANGMRWNKEKNRCELHLRNSWGSLAPYHGWTDMTDILRATYRTNYIE